MWKTNSRKCRALENKTKKGRHPITYYCRDKSSDDMLVYLQAIKTLFSIRECKESVC